MKMKTVFYIVLFIALIITAYSCKRVNSVSIIIGEKACVTEKLTAEQLKKNLEQVSGKSVTILKSGDNIPSNGVLYILGTSASNSIIGNLLKKRAIVLSENFPGKRGGIWAKANLNSAGKAIVLAGSDVQGAQYAVYDYTHEVLGIDPFEYWTGKKPNAGKLFDPFNFNNRIIAPPEVPILCYFENDVDELANLKDPLLEYDWQSYTEMIKSLVRLKYNAIHLFDMLGRPEFFLRPEYKKIRPDYDIRISFIDSLIDYAHDMGMMVQIDLALGYKIKPMEQEKAGCWRKYKDEWIGNWIYYFEETPIGKADIFSLRPRNQVWDWEFASSCDENKTDVFNEVYDVLGKLIDRYNPQAIKVATCYADAMEMFNTGFNPPKDWIIAWSDNGWGKFDILPENTRDYNFGTYMHAGFWKNHTVHDPYPARIDSAMKMMGNQFKANKYWEINGQHFRPFLLNIEAFAAIANNPGAFSGETFYEKWSERYFEGEAAVFAVKSMKKLHEAHFGNIGYVQHLWEIKEVISYLGETEIERPGKISIAYDYTRVELNFEHVKTRIKFLSEARAEAEKGLPKNLRDNTFYHDYILLPVYLYLDLLTFEDLLHEVAKLKKEYEETGDRTKLRAAASQLNEAEKALETVYGRKVSGDKDIRWKGWYNPSKRRPNNGFPTLEMIDQIKLKLSELK